MREDLEDVFLAQHAHLIVGLEAEARIHLHAADRRQIVAVELEEQPAEHGFGGFQRRRLAGTHDAIDVDQRFFARRVLVGHHRVADIGADIDVIDAEHRQFLHARLLRAFRAHRR